MSRQLPPRPSLDHLKKQAKALLRELRLTRPDAELTDAQHALAKEYGFPSWPKLKAHVESAATTPPAAPASPVAFHRFTYKSRQALFFSRFEAAQQGSRAIEPAHMLLGLLKAARDVPRNPFSAASSEIDTTRLRRQAGAALGSAVIIPFARVTDQAIRAAIAEADAMGHDRVGLAHVVLGLLRARDSLTTESLHDAGLDLEMVR